MAQGMIFEPDGTTLEQASVKAKAEKKLIFLDCYTDWCGPCKKMAREVFPDPKAGEFMNPRFINLKINMESEYGAPLAKKLQISAYPTFVIFNAEAQEIGRLVGGSPVDDFLAKVKDKSQDNTSADLETRWKNGDRDPQFLKQYLATLTSAYKSDDANDVAEAILKGNESKIATDAELRSIFMRNINNPFSDVFQYVVKNPNVITDVMGTNAYEMKVNSVLSNYQRNLINEEDGKATLDQQKFDQYVDLLKDMNVPQADHYRLTTLITYYEKNQDFDNYIACVKEYLANTELDANDMQLANWVKPFAGPEVDKSYKDQMKTILQTRLIEIKAGKRQPMTQIGNMRLSRPTDELLEMIINALDGKMPGQ
jgi:thiol-disulfide isomerase/thioredoxin